MPILLCDTRQQAGKHDAKEVWFASRNIELRRTKLYVGDYTLPTNQSICVDTKKDVQELIGDICGKQHARFRAECERAKESGIKLIVLVENKGEWLDSKKTIWNKPITTIQDLFGWKNKRAFIWKGGKQLYPNATKGSTLAKACITMQTKYGVEFRFCSPDHSAETILKLLGVEL